MENNGTLGEGHAMRYTDDVIELCTPAPYSLINQCHPNTFNLKKCVFHDCRWLLPHPKLGLL